MLAYLSMQFNHTNVQYRGANQPFTLLEGSHPFREYKLMTARRAHDPRRCVAFCILAVGMVESGETATRAHLFDA